MPPSSSQVGDRDSNTLEILVKADSDNASHGLLVEEVFDDDDYRGTAYSIIDNVPSISEFDFYERTRQCSEFGYDNLGGQYELICILYLCLVFDSPDVAPDGYKWIPLKHLDEYVEGLSFISELDRKMRKTIPDSIEPSDRADVVAYAGMSPISEKTQERKNNSRQIGENHKTLDQFGDK
jgi:hypothetical protein